MSAEIEDADLKLVSVVDLLDEEKRAFSRSDARPYADSICLTLNSSSPDTVVAVSLSKVEVLDIGGADEMIGRLQRQIQSQQYPDRYAVLLNMKPDVKDSVDVALTRGRGAMIAVEAQGWSIIGTLSEGQRKVLAVLMDKGGATASQLEEDYGIKRASATLGELHRLGLVRRRPYTPPKTGKGRGFYYYRLVNLEEVKRHLEKEERVA